MGATGFRLPQREHQRRAWHCQTAKRKPRLQNTGRSGLQIARTLKMRSLVFPFAFISYVPWTPLIKADFAALLAPIQLDIFRDNYDCEAAEARRLRQQMVYFLAYSTRPPVRQSASPVSPPCLLPTEPWNNEAHPGLSAPSGRRVDPGPSTGLRREQPVYDISLRTRVQERELGRPRWQHHHKRKMIPLLGMLVLSWQTY